MFDWARFQLKKGAIRLQLQLDHQGCLPYWALVTDGDTNDVRIAQQLTFASSIIVTVDRGYLDHALHHRWTVTDVGFVTRPQINMLYEIMDRRPVLTDAVIRLTGLHAADRCPIPLRLVTIGEESQQRTLTFLTNIMHLATSTIAAIYKERW